MTQQEDPRQEEARRKEGRNVARIVWRWLLALVGAVAILLGSAVTAAGVWLDDTLDANDELTTASQVISAPACQTLLIEVSGAQVSADEWNRYAFVADRSEETIAIDVPGAQSSYLVGLADSDDVEERLLGAQYCLALSTEQGWTVERIAVVDELPDVGLSGLPGVWGRSSGAEAVVLPLPESGRTVVVSSDDGTDLGEVRLVGRYRIDGAGDAATVALIAGPSVIGVGVVLVLIAIFALRRRGRHEGSAD